MLSTDYRAASALMDKRYQSVDNFELTTANEAGRANLLKNIELPPARAVTGRLSFSRIRALLSRLGTAGT